MSITTDETGAEAHPEGRGACRGDHSGPAAREPTLALGQPPGAPRARSSRGRGAQLPRRDDDLARAPCPGRAARGGARSPGCRRRRPRGDAHGQPAGVRGGVARGEPARRHRRAGEFPAPGRGDCGQPREIGYILENAGATALFVDELGAETGEQAVNQVSHDVELIGLDDVESTAPSRYSAVLEEGHDAIPTIDVPEDSPALIMYTSGTTGRPKGAVLTHMNLLSQSVVLMRAYQLMESDEVNLVASPMFHIGAIGSIAPLILIGGTMVILPSRAFDPAAVLRLLEEERVTSAFLVPAQWQAMVDHDSLPDRDLSRLRTTSWGAAPATR